MINYIKNIFCKHKNTKFIRNIYGDEIIWSGYKRSIHICLYCKKYIYKNGLYIKE